MRESSQQRYRMAYRGLTEREESEDARKGKALDERTAAVRRWISDDDDSVCRSID